jgi:hypothetical protein
MMLHDIHDADGCGCGRDADERFEESEATTAATLRMAWRGMAVNSAIHPPAVIYESLH